MNVKYAGSDKIGATIFSSVGTEDRYRNPQKQTQHKFVL